MPHADAYYPLDPANTTSDGTVYDLAGYRNLRTGTIPSYGGWNENAVTGGRSHDGYNMPIDRTPMADFAYDNNLTASGWVYLDDTISGDKVILQTPSVLVTRTTSDYLKFKVAVSPEFSSTTFLPAKTWTHYAVVRDGRSLKLYINGRLDTSAVISNAALTAYNSAKRLNLEDNHTQTLTDEYVFYKEALTPDQVAYIYYKGKNGLELSQSKKIIVPLPVPTHYFTFDNADYSAPTLSDKVGTLNLSNINGVAMGETTNSVVAESAHFLRFEDSIYTGGGTNEIGKNTAGTKQYFEGIDGNYIHLGKNFSITTWFRQNDAISFFTDDKSAILDQWGPEVDDQSFRLYFTPTNGKFNLDIRISNKIFTVSSNWDTRNNNSTAWAHIMVTREERWLRMYINGWLSGETVIDNGYTTLDVNLPTNPIRVRVAESSEYGYYYQSSTVSVTNGSNVVTSSGTTFLTDLQETMTGTIDTTNGLTTVTGTSTAFTSELAVWADKTITTDQVWQLYQDSSGGTALATTPQVAMDGYGSAQTDQTRANLTISDCQSYDSVWVGFDGDTQPAWNATGDATYNGWVSCSTAAGAIQSAALNPLATNNLRIWFKTGTNVTYSTTVSIDQVSGDTTPPTAPTITMTTSSPTTLSFARFSVSSCSTSETIAGVLIQHNGTAPTASDSRWKSCTTVADAFLSPTLKVGANTLAAYVKDNAGNITAYGSTFPITFNGVAIPSPDIYLNMDDAQYTSGFLREVMSNVIFDAYNNSNISTGQTGIANESIDFNSTGYFESHKMTSQPTSALTFSAWVNLDLPSTASHIAVIRNTTGLQLYINNVLAGSATIDSGNFVSSSIEYHLGAQERGSVSDPTNGQVDEVATWNSALTTTELEAVYAEGLRTNNLSHEVRPQAASVPDYYWNFDNSLYEATQSNYLDPVLSSIQLNNINLGTQAVAGATGQVAEAFTFDGSNRMDATVNPLNLGDTFTISIWTKMSADGLILSKWYDQGNGATEDVTDQEFKLFTSGQFVNFSYHTTATDVAGDPGFTTVQSQNKITLNQWNMITITRKQDDLRFYINGSVAGVSTAIGVNPLITSSSTEPLRIGGNLEANSFLTGDADELYIDTVALTERQVKYLYDLGAANTASPTVVKITPDTPSGTIPTSSVNLTVGDCLTYTHMIAIDNGAAAPAAGSITTACSTAQGALNYASLPATNNTVDVYFKDAGSAVYGPFSVPLN